MPETSSARGRITKSKYDEIHHCQHATSVNILGGKSSLVHSALAPRVYCCTTGGPTPAPPTPEDHRIIMDKGTPLGFTRKRTLPRGTEDITSNAGMLMTQRAEPQPTCCHNSRLPRELHPAASQANLASRDRRPCFQCECTHAGRRNSSRQASACISIML